MAALGEAAPEGEAAQEAAPNGEAAPQAEPDSEAAPEATLNGGAAPEAAPDTDVAGTCRQAAVAAFAAELPGDAQSDGDGAGGAPAAPNEVAYVTNQGSGVPPSKEAAATREAQSPPPTEPRSPREGNAADEGRSAGRTKRQCLGAKGLGITGTGQLPVLDAYLSDLAAARKQPSAVTQYLDESLYKHHEPPKLPQRLQSYYLGPEARQPDLYSSTGLPQRPASASSSSSLPRLHGGTSAFAHVKPRIWSSVGARELSPNRSPHSQLLHGSESPSSRHRLLPPSTTQTTLLKGAGALLGSTFPFAGQASGPAGPERSESPQRLASTAPWQQQQQPLPRKQGCSPPKVAPRPVRAGDSLSKSYAAELQQLRGSTFRSSPQRAQAAQREQSPVRLQQQSLAAQLPAHALLQAALPPGPVSAGSLQYSAPSPSSPRLQPLPTGSSKGLRPPPLSTASPVPSAAGMHGSSPSPSPHAAGSPATTHRQQQARLKVQRFVADVGRVMGRLQPGTNLAPGVQEGWGPEGKGPGANAGGQPRARQRPGAAAAAAAAWQRSLCVPLYTQVALPASLQGVASASGKSGGAKMLHDLYEREGHTKSTIRKMLDQLPQLNRLEETLLQTLAGKFVPFSYPPNSLMLAQGTACDEVLVLLSGQVLVQPRSEFGKASSSVVDTPAASQAQPVSLQPGAVVGLDLMLKKLQVPNDVRSDPHFECHVAVLQWEAYQQELCSWAASKVLQHLPGLQFSVEAQLRAAISQHSFHLHREAGAAVYTEGGAADAVVLLVQGQLLVAEQLQPDAIITEGQLMHHLRVTLGPSQDLVTLHPPAFTKASSRGLRRNFTGRSKAFQAALLRRQAMQVSPANSPHSKVAAVGACETVPEEEGEEDTSSRGRTPDGRPASEMPAAGSAEAAQDAAAPHGSVPVEPLAHKEHSGAGSTTEGLGGGGEEVGKYKVVGEGSDGAGELGAAGTSEQLSGAAGDGPHSKGTPQLVQQQQQEEGERPRQQQVQAWEEVHGQQLKQPHQRQDQAQKEAHGQQQEQQQDQAQGQVHGQQAADRQQCSAASLTPLAPPAPHGELPPVVCPSLPPLPPMPSIRSKLGGVSAAPFASTASLLSSGAGSARGSSWHSPHDASHASSPRHAFLRGGSGGGGGAAAAHLQGMHSVSAGAKKTQVGHKRAASHDGLLGIDAGIGGAELSGAPDVAPLAAYHSSGALFAAAPEHRSAFEQWALGSEQSSELVAPPQPGTSGREGWTGSMSGEGGSQVRGSSQGASERSHAAGSQGASICGRIEGGEGADGASSGAASVGSESGLAAAAADSQPASGAGEEGVGEEGSETGAVPEGLKGIPLLNALATMLKTHHQQVEAVFSQPVFIGTEALHPTQDARVHGSTVLSLQSTECILIPRSALVSVLPQASLALLRKRMQAQAHNIATTTSGAPQGTTIERWPECADTLREFLQTKPGARLVWQAENLADGFSSVKALAQLPWQARLRLFQGLKHMMVHKADPALSLALTGIEVVAMPLPGQGTVASELQPDEEASSGAGVCSKGGEEQQEGVPARAHAKASSEALQAEGQEEQERREAGEGQEQEAASSNPDPAEDVPSGARVLRPTVTGAIRGINASVAEAEAAMARFRLLGGAAGEGEDSGSGPEGSGTQEADARARQSTASGAPGEGQGESEGDEIQDDDGDWGKEVDGNDMAPLLRSKSTVKAQLPADPRQLRSPDSALKRLMAAAEAAEVVVPSPAVARISAAGSEAGGLSHVGAPRAAADQRGDQKTRSVAGSEAGSEPGIRSAGEQAAGATADPAGDAGAGAGAGGEREEEEQGPVQQGLASLGKAGLPERGQGASGAAGVHWAGGAGGGDTGAEGRLAGQALEGGSSSNYLSRLAALHDPSRTLGTPDTDKLGSLKSWDGWASQDAQLPYSGPCTPPMPSQGAAVPYPAAYLPYDMDARPTAQHLPTTPAAAPDAAAAVSLGKPPLLKGAHGMPSLAARLGQGPKASPSEERPVPALPPKPPPAKKASSAVPAVKAAASAGPASLPAPHAQAAPASAAAAATGAGAQQQRAGGEGEVPHTGAVASVRQRVVVVDPTGEHKDDQHYIVLSGTIVLQAQALVGHEDALTAMQLAAGALPPHLAEQPQHKRRSAAQPQVPAPLVLATLGLGDAFNASMALGLLRARVAAAAQAAAAAAEEEAEQARQTQGPAAAVAGVGGSGTGGVSRALKARGKSAGEQLPLPPGPCQIVAVVATPQVELLGMNAALFELVVGCAGRAMAKLEVQDVLKQVGAGWMGELWSAAPRSSLHASPRAAVPGGAASTSGTAADSTDAPPATLAAAAALQSGMQGSGSASSRLSVDEVAKGLMDACRMEEHKKGLELLRRGEASACVFVVVSGCCVLRSSYMGLSAEVPGQGAIMMDLLKAKAGETVGELSLLASRPLWYSLVVASPTARVVSIDLQALKDYISTHMPPDALEKMLHRVAEKDLRLYATAIHTQALLIQQGKILLDMFSPTMRTMLKQVLMLGPIGAKGVQGAALETMEAIARGNRAPSKGAPSKGAGRAEGPAGMAGKKREEEEGEGEERTRLVAAAKEVGPVVVEHANEADRLVDSLARPTAIPAQANELQGMAQWERQQRRHNQYLTSITSGSHVLQHSSFQLSTLLHATQHPYGAHDVLGDLAKGARYEGWSSHTQSHEGWSNHTQSHQGPERVVHVCMPTSSVPGDDPFMVRPPHEPRPAQRIEHKTGPRAISGEEVERRWDVPNGQAPSSVLSADEVMGLLRARVHLKRPHLAAALSRSQNLLHSQAEAAADEWAAEHGSRGALGDAGETARAAGGSGGARFWGEGDAGYWDEAKFVRELPERAVIVSEGTGSLFGVQAVQQLQGGCERVGDARVSFAGRSNASRRASMSIARQSDFEDDPLCASRRRRSMGGGMSGRVRRLSTALDHPGAGAGGAHSATGLPGHMPGQVAAQKSKARARSEARLVAARNRGRLGRTLQRRLTEWTWDDSANALQELTARKPDATPSTSGNESSSSSSEYDLLAEAQKLEDARVLGLQFSALGQGMRSTSKGSKLEKDADGEGQSEAPSASELDQPQQQRSTGALGSENSFGVHRHSAALADVREEEEGGGKEAEVEAQLSSTHVGEQQQADMPNLDPEDSGLSPQRTKSLIASAARSMRRRQSMVRWSLDGRSKSPVQPAQSAGSQDGPHGQMQSEQEGFGSSDAQGVPEAILQALAGEVSEPEVPLITHTYSMGQAAVQAADKVLLDATTESLQQEGSMMVTEPSSAAEPVRCEGANAAGSEQGSADGSSSQSTCSQNGKLLRHGQQAEGRGSEKNGGKEVDLQDRHFWVRDCLHDPSGITNPSMSLLMGEALAKAMAVDMNAGSNTAAASLSGVQHSAPPPLTSEASHCSSLATAPSMHSLHNTTAGAGAEKAPADWSVRVKLPPPRGSLNPPKMRGLPEDEEDTGGMEHGDQEKKLLESLWREHNKAVAEAEKAERKHAIRSALEIAGPGPGGLNAGPAASERPDWDKQGVKVQSPAARQAMLKALLKQAAQSRRPVIFDKRGGPMLAPKGPPKVAAPPQPRAPPTASPALASSEGKGQDQPACKLACKSPDRERSTISISDLQAEQQQQQQQLKGGWPAAGPLGEGAAAAQVLPDQQATASQLQRTALPPFSSNMMAKNWERQRARGSHGPLPVQGRPATAVARTGPQTFSPHLHQQQLQQQQHLLRQEAQGWWGMQGLHAGAGAADEGASVASVGGALQLSGGSGAAEAGMPASAPTNGAIGSRAEEEQAVRVSHKLEVDAKVLTEEDLAFVTVQVPPRTRITPEIDLSSHKPAQQHQKEQPVKYKRREPHMHMHAMMDKVSGPHAKVGSSKTKGKTTDHPAYVPTFLRPKRTSLAPEMSRVQVDHEAWVVPQFSSTGGFEYGLFDVHNEITYFD